MIEHTLQHTCLAKICFPNGNDWHGWMDELSTAIVAY